MHQKTSEPQNRSEDSENQSADLRKEAKAPKHSDHDGSHHSHGHDHFHGPAKDNKKGLVFALAITGGIMVLEFVGGLVTNSLALLSDSGHMLNDTASLALSLVAFGMALRPTSAKRTYGFHRFEILAALFNGLSLFAIAVLIMKEAWERFFDPPVVASGSMMVIALVGLLANLLSAAILIRKSDVKGNINVRSAYLHILGDALGSIGAILAGLIMSLFSWYLADPIISVLVALLILRGAWGVVKNAVHILMEGTPPHLDAAEVKAALTGLPGVSDVHDLHIWTITSGLDALSCHLKVETSGNVQNILQDAAELLEHRFGIDHTTIQIETACTWHEELKV